jgi:hypothetical protein
MVAIIPPKISFTVIPLPLMAIVVGLELRILREPHGLGRLAVSFFRARHFEPALHDCQDEDREFLRLAMDLQLEPFFEKSLKDRSRHFRAWRIVLRLGVDFKNESSIQPGPRSI